MTVQEWYVDWDDAFHDRAWHAFLTEPWPQPTIAEQLETARPAWHGRAACRDAGVDFFDPAQADTARTLCDGCPVSVDCATAGRREPVGVWAGQARGFAGSAGCVGCGRDGVRILGRGLCSACYYRERRARA